MLERRAAERRSKWQNDDALARLRVILSAPPSQASFRALCMHLARCNDTMLPVHLKAATRGLTTWPDELREGPRRWFAAALSGRAEPRLRIVRIGSLMRCGIGDQRLAALAGARDIAGLRVLRLDANRIGAKGARALATSPHLRNLEMLLLAGNHIGDEGAAALAQTKRLPKLQTLDLSGNGIGDTGVVALARAAHMKGLTNLYLDENEIGDQGAIAMAEAQSLPQLSTLMLDDNPITRVGFQALARSRHLPKVRRLHWESIALSGCSAPRPDSE